LLVDGKFAAAEVVLLVEANMTPFLDGDVNMVGGEATLPTESVAAVSSFGQGEAGKSIGTTGILGLTLTALTLTAGRSSSSSSYK
jgi:hypothetical protein